MAVQRNTNMEIMRFIGIDKKLFHFPFSALVEQVLLDLIHETASIDEVDSGESVSHERYASEGASEPFFGDADHFRFVWGSDSLQAVVDFIERYDLLADFLFQFRPVVL